MVGLGMVLSSVVGSFHWVTSVVETATGWGGFVIIGVYSFLIAFALPLPSEIVLAAPLIVAIPGWLELLLIILVSATGKAAGSVFAFWIGHEAKSAGPVVRTLERLGFSVQEWSRRHAVKLAKRYGYAGLAVALSIPFVPDTLSIYAFSILGEDYYKFAVSTFLGSAGRLVVTVAIFEGTTTIF